MVEKLDKFMISIFSQCSMHPLGISDVFMIILNSYWIIKLRHISDLNSGEEESMRDRVSSLGGYWIMEEVMYSQNFGNW